MQKRNLKYIDRSYEHMIANDAVQSRPANGIYIKPARFIMSDD